MCVKYFYRWLLIVTGMMLAVCVNAQELPVSDYNELPGTINSGLVSEGVVCPSLDSDKDGTSEVSSLSTFRLSAYDATETDLGQGADNIFEWVVYGGWITGINGAPIVVANHANSRQRTSIGNIRYSYISVIGVANPAEVMENWEAFIEVEWDTTNFSTVNGWVAVKHSNEWNCSDGNWSVITNTIDNSPPAFVEADFPEDIRLPDQLKNNFTLPLPAASDDGCNQTPFLSYKLTFPDATEISNNENNRIVNLQTGNNVVEWTVSDGSLTATRSYTITVEPVLEILNVAWTQPTCDGATDGALMVTGLTAYSFLGDVEFSFNGGAYSTTAYLNGLGAGNYTIDARIIYTIDANNDDVDESYTQQAEATYTGTLTANAAAAVDVVPSEGPNAIVTNTDCQNSATGSVRVSSEVMLPQNHSVAFDGDDYLLLNKQYNAAMNAFTVATWIKVPSAGITEGTLLSFDNEQYFQLSLVYFSLSGVTRVRLQTNSEEGVFVHTTPINDDEWHLVVATYSNGNRAIYIDGELQEQSASLPLQVGNGSEVRYGMIGAASKTATFFADPQPNFFKGDMAEMAIWDGVSLSSADVDNMMKHGMSGMSDHWVFNSTPVNVSVTRPDVFTDLGNTVNTAHWARFFNGSRSDNNAPWLLSWTDDVPATIDADYEAGDELLGLGVGNYTLHVKDILACGEITATYEVENSDALQPELFWNAALEKTAGQLQTNGSNFASLAVDGFGATNPAASSSETGSTNDVWWEVDLEGIFPIRMIRIHPASDFSNFYVMASQSPFNAASTLVEDLARVGDTRVQHSGTTNGSTTIMLTANARYLRIRASGTASLHLAEVEVMTNMTPVPPRILTLGSGSCVYTITDDEFSIAPVAYDVCDGITSFTNSENGGADLIGVELSLGDHPVTWTATDDVPLSGMLDINYRVVDETPAEFFPLPFANGTQTITYCQSQSYNLPIPKISDNYPLSCGDFTSLELYSDVFRAYQYSPIEDYDPAVNEMTGNLDYENYLRPGDHVLEWRVEDHSENLTSDRLTLHVELEPRVLEVKTSPITCNGANNAQVTFSQIESEQDVNPLVDVIYVLKSTVAPFDELPRQSNNPVFNNVPVGTYNAFIEVNTCVSNNYYEVISVSEPAAITLTEEISPVRCSGEANGGIALTVSGGSQTNILHLLGGDSQGATAANYAAINLAGEGSIEGWIYLDELGSAPGEVNYNAALFGVLDGAGQGYGLRMSNGVLTFYAGAESVQANAVDIQPRNWYHVAGSWDAANARIDLTINASVAYNAVIPGAFDAPDGGALYFGELADADDDHVLRGFVRNVRIWNTAITTTDMANNFYLLDPIDASGSLVANYPLAAGGGTILQNRVPGGSSGSINTANYAWQKFAYYWENSSGVFVARTKDISAQVADDYTVTLDDPMACAPVSATFTININDTYRPVMTFSNEGYGGAALSVGEPIRRFTDDINADVRNVAGDCVYYPAALEFDPEVEDDVCPEEDVVLTFEVLSGAFDAASVPAADAATLDGSAMTDEMRIRWTATDPAGNSRTAEVNYYIIDNEAPVLAWSDQVRETDPGDCGYTVTAADVNILPTLTENCSSGRLYNNINGLSTLEGAYFEPGTYTIRWTYDDKQFPGAYFAAQSTMVEQTLTVEDNQVPQAVCKAPFTVQLNASGSYTIENIDVDNGSNDNCGLLSAIHITKNVAYGKTATQIDNGSWDCGDGTFGPASNAVDGNTSGLWGDCTVTHTASTDHPWWQVDLSEQHTIYQIRVYNRTDCCSDRLSDFYVLISDNEIAAAPADWGNPAWPADVKVHYFSGAAGPMEIFDIPAETGRYVKLWSTNNQVLSLAEVEVYGTPDVANATSLVVDCEDVRYTPAADTGEPGVWDDAQGSFAPIGVLLSAIDQNGNVYSCMTDVTVEDRIQPTVIPVNATVYLDSDGNIDLNDFVDDIDDGSNDACGVETMWITPREIQSCVSIGNFDVRLYVRDVNGNIDWRRATVSIADNIPPGYQKLTDIELPLDPDGVYQIQPEDIFADIWDNCTVDDDLIYNFSPNVVECTNLENDGYIDLSVTITDANGQTTTVVFDANDPDLSARVQVVDHLAPVASLENFVLIIPEDGDSMIRFQDIIPNANLFDNCDKFNVPVKLISYDEGTSWCPGGSEGSGQESEFVNYAIKPFNSVTASEVEYSGNVVSNATDEEVSTAFISGGTTGNRWIQYDFGIDYALHEFNEVEVIWHDEVFSTVEPISQTLSPTVSMGNIGTYYGAYDPGASERNQCKDGTGGNGGDYNSWFRSLTKNNNSSGNNVESIYVMYDFGSNVIMSSTLVNWDTDLPSSDGGGPYIQTRPDGGSWSSTTIPIGFSIEETDYTANLGNVSARYVRIVFNRPRGDEVEMREWIINRNTGNDCILPTAASTSLQYSNDELNWTDVSGCSPVSVAGSPSLNACSFSSNITARYFRLNFNTAYTAYVGIKELRLYGREIPTAANAACTKYDCSSVNTAVDVWLQWEDNAGNNDDAQVQINVVPYFDIFTIDIKDCGYDGERYYPTITGRVDDRTYSYTWDEIDDVDYWGGSNDLFQEFHCNKVDNDELPYTMPTADQDWINIITSNCSPYPNDGDYSINLLVTDDNGCWDDFNYNFTYDESNTTATSIDSTEACISTEETYGVRFPVQWSFWRYDNREFFWDNLDDLVTANQITIIDGGRSFGDPLSPRGDDFVTLTFDRSTTDVGSTTNFTYRYRAMQYTGGVTTTGPNLLTGTGATVYGRILVVLDSLETGGPYWTESNTRDNYYNMPVGTKYVRTNDNNTWFGDFANCMESRQFRATVYEVTPPVIYAYDAYNSETWIPAANLQVCPRDTIWYRVENIATGDYEYYEWSILNSGSNATGRRLAQGNWYDDSIQIVWDQFPITPELTVSGYNMLDCPSTPTVITHVYNDNEAPLLGENSDNDCSALNQIRANTPGQCAYTFQNLEPPLMIDNCRNRIADYWCEVDIDGDGSFDIIGKNAQGTYEVGVTTVTWYAEDYSGNQSNCSHTVTVLDTEAPLFNKIPTDTTLYANADCEHVFAGTKRDVTADDNCVENTLNLTCDIDHLDDGSFEQSGLASLNGITFEPGVSRVVWTATDNVDNSAYVLDGFPANNEVDVDFFVSVVDNTPPVIDQNEATPEIDPLNEITANNDPDQCAATLVIAPPGSAEIDDNCSLDAALVVEFTGRDDGEDELSDPFPVGTTTLTWRVTDEAGNYATATQLVTVSDTQEPWFDNDDAGVDGDPVDPALVDRSIGYCMASRVKLPIPEPFDNCLVDRIDWTVVNNGGTAYSASGFITRAQSANFNPNGDDSTSVIPALPVDDVLGSDYTVTWTVTDVANPVANPCTEIYSYNLHVEMEPYFNLLEATEMSCGDADDGKITMVTTGLYRAEPGYDVHYTIDNWESFQVNNPIFEGLTGGTYNVQMRVNGCYSGVSQATITQPEVYDIELSATHPYCYEATDGSIDMTMSGGVAGQVHFAGGAGLTALHYSELDLTSSGSIEAWVYLESLDDVTLLAKGNDYALKLLGGKFTIQVGPAYLGDAANEGAGISPGLRRWYYVAGSWQVGTGMQLSVNDAPQGGTIQGGALVDAPVNSSNVSIGNNFEGIIREARIWSTVVDGLIPSSKYTGSEAGLEAFWPLDDGAGNDAANSCYNKNEDATAATGASLLWDASQPQPGTYTWTKDGAFYSNDIDLTGLGRGVYQLSFQDPYNCPADLGLQRSRTITPTDNEQPLISTPENNTLFVDPGNDCQRVITAQDFIDYNLKPTITDDCDFSTTWRITPQATLIPQDFSGDDFTGAVLELGQNRVDVTAIQYDGTVSSSAFYFITVEDNIPPVANGKSVSDVNLSNDYTPMGSGIVFYDAFGFDDGSQDNCSPVQDLTFELSYDGVIYSSELSFDKDDVNQEVTVYFRVSDAAGLSHVESGNTMTVQDIYDPVFIGATNKPYQACATVDGVGAVPASTIIPSGSLRLDASDYSDNVNILPEDIEYMLDHETYAGGDTGWLEGDDPSADAQVFYEGVTSVWFRITDPSTNSAEEIIYTVTILPKPAPSGGIQ